VAIGEKILFCNPPESCRILVSAEDTLSDKTVTIEANVLEQITLAYDAGPAAIGRALASIHEFLEDVFIEATHSRELKVGTQPSVVMSNIVASLGQAAQIFGASSGLAGVQMVPPGANVRQMQ
jgi:hypothetical protein